MEAVQIPGPAGTLDGRWHAGARGPVLMLHPHPLHGGSMGSRLVYDLASSLSKAGFGVLRFDFRGVNRSEGRYGRGEGEVADAAASWDWLAQKTGRNPIVFGYSFGAAVALHLAGIRSVPRLVTAGLPVTIGDSALDPTTAAAQVRCRTRLIVGTNDEFVTPAATWALARNLAGSHGVTVLEGAHHFLEPSHNPRVGAVVLEELADEP